MIGPSYVPSILSSQNEDKNAVPTSTPLNLTTPYGMSLQQPNFGPFTPAITKNANPVTGATAGNKNNKLALMLYALGGALKGDKNFVENTMQLQQMQEGKKKQEEQNKLWEKFKTEHSIDPQVSSLGDMMEPNQRLELMMKTMDKGNGKIFEGQGFNNQLFNILLQGQKDPSIRQSPIYKTAYDRLSQPQTETYINEVGQQVTRKIPGIISQEDYLPPTGVAAVDEKPDVTEPKKEEIVKVSPERRKTLLKQVDTVNAAERKIIAFKEKIDVVQPNPLTSGKDRADIQSSYTALLLELKNLAELGVLAGEDLKLLQDMVGDPTGFKQFFIAGGTEGIKIQLDNLLSSISGQKTPIYTELGMEMPKGTVTQRKETAYLGGKKIEVNAAGDGWIYSDTREAVEQ